MSTFRCVFSLNAFAFRQIFDKITLKVIQLYVEYPLALTTVRGMYEQKI